MTARPEGAVTAEAIRRLADIDAAFPDLRAELIDGNVRVDTVVPPVHGQTIMTIGAQLMPKWCVTTAVDTFHDGWHGDGPTLLRPDLSVTDPACRGTRRKQFPAEEVLLVVEVVSESGPDDDTVAKVRKYAQAGIPYYLVADPVAGQCLLHSLPDGDSYRSILRTDFGVPVPVGDPINTVLDTTGLHTY